LLFFVKSNKFTSRQFTIFFSIAFAAAFLTRWTAPIFILGPLVMVFFQILYRREYSFSLINNILLFICIGILLPGAVYYIPKATFIISYIQANVSSSKQWVESSNYLPSDLQNQFSTHSIMFYFNIISEQTIYFLIFFFIGTAIAIIH